MLELIEWDFRIALGFGVSISSWVQSGSGVSVLMRVASNFEFRRLLDINKARGGAIGFWGVIRVSGLKDKRFH